MFITDRIDQINAIKSQVRQQIMEFLVHQEKCTAKLIAEYINCPHDGIYYHLKALEKVNLIRSREVKKNGVVVDRTFELCNKGNRLIVKYKPNNSENVKAIKELASSISKSAIKDFNDGFFHENVKCEGELRNLWTFRARGWLNDDDMKALNLYLWKISDLFQKEKTEDNTHFQSCSVTIAPCRM